jgi:hypothetical protein
LLLNSTAGKVSAVAIAVFLLGIGSIALYIANENRHSYQVGNEWGTNGGAFSAVVNGGVDVESYCQQGFVASGYGPAGIARDPFFDGCRDAVAEVVNGGR